MAPLIGGSGGGKPELAQAGGNRPDNLAAALEKLYPLVGG
jgi:alanyl-tRNA synthetase